MRIDVRPVARLRGPAAIDLAAVLGPVLGALTTSSLDLSRVSVLCDWIQYQGNFREPVQLRPVLAEQPDAADRALEVAVDLRRGAEADVDLGTDLKDALARHADPGRPPGIVLEAWAPVSESCIWRFNTLYWQALSLWEQATGQAYEQALPGGRSGGSDDAAARELIYELLRVWDDLDARRALPEELYVIEFGVGNGSQAATWLDTFAELDKAHGRGYYQRLHYLMGDYSPHVLGRARQAVSHHEERISSLVLDATSPLVTLGFLRGKAFCVYISNVYDNLPTDEVAVIAGRPYVVHARAFIPDAGAAQIAARYGVPVADLARLVDRLLRLGPELLSEAAPQTFPDPDDAVGFWRDAWAAVRLQERYAPLEGLDAYQAAPGLTGEILHPLIGSHGDIRMQVSNGALASFSDTLPLLHPFGRLTCHDLFVTEPTQYQSGFYGPGKYDGSVVNWVNGPLLQLAGSRRGFHVAITPFTGREAANVKTLTATMRD
jgi:hypothetical protein